MHRVLHLGNAGHDHAFQFVRPQRGRLSGGHDKLPHTVFRQWSQRHGRHVGQETMGEDQGRLRAIVVDDEGLRNARLTLVLAARREDRQVHAFSVDTDRAGSFDASAPERRGDWLDYVMAPVFALLERGVRVTGLDLGIASRVPLESGLSSSAALEGAVTMFRKAGR